MGKLWLKELEIEGTISVWGCKCSCTENKDTDTSLISNRTKLQGTVLLAYAHNHSENQRNFRQTGNQTSDLLRGWNKCKQIQGRPSTGGEGGGSTNIPRGFTPPPS